MLLIPSVVLNFFLLTKSKNTNEGIQVLGVIDGDTIVLEGKTRLRLRCLDAPELNFCGGEEAKRRLEELVNNQGVLIKEQIIDQKGRPMGLVYVDNISINEILLKEGLVRFHSDASTEREKLKAAADLAKAQKIGVYSEECTQTKNIDNPRCIIKGNIDKNSTNRIYYLPDCAQYEFTVVEKDLGENWFCTEAEAQAAGFRKSENCAK